MKLRSYVNFFWIYFQARLLLFIIKIGWFCRDFDQKTVVVVPADPVSVVGSKGDEAMYSALKENLLTKKENIIIDVLVSRTKFEFKSAETDVNPVPIWGGAFFVLTVFQYLLMRRPSSVYVIGADVMDGTYSPVNSLRMAVVAELAASLGMPSIVTGFSFNPKCPWFLKKAYLRMACRAKYHVRDPISLEFIRPFIPHAKLVADLAFLLKPTSISKSVEEVSSWVDGQKQTGRIVLGLNFHPMLFEGGENDPDYVTFLDSLVAALRSLVVERSVSILLVPHDERAFAGDVHVLRNLSERFGESSDYVRYLGPPPSAGDLKMVASKLDLVITGRMHLCIAALGVGTPVVAFAYQSKFLGLFAHFDYPPRFVIDPILKPKFDIKAVFSEAITDRAGLRALIETKLGSVKNLSMQNFE